MDPSSSALSSSNSSANSNWKERARKQVQDLKDDADLLRKELQICMQKEEEIKAKLEAERAATLKKSQQQREFGRAVEGLKTALPNLNIVLRNAAELENSIRLTRERADNISGKVRSMDQARSRAVQALSRVRCIIDLKDCMNNVQKALLDGDFVAGAEYVYKYHQVNAAFAALSEAAIIQQQHSPRSSSMKKLPVATTTSVVAAQTIDKDIMERTEEELRVGVLKQISDSSNACLQDPQNGPTWLENPALLSVEKGYTVLGRLGVQKEACERYTQFLRQILSKRIDYDLLMQGLDGSVDAPAPVASRIAFAELLRQVYNSAVDIIRIIPQRFSTESFDANGVSFLSALLAGIHAEVDKLSCRIFFHFIRLKRLRDRTKAISKYNANQHFHLQQQQQVKASSDQESPEAQHPFLLAVNAAMEIGDTPIGVDSLVLLSSLLVEICVMLQHTESFDRFIRDKASKAEAIILSQKTASLSATSSLGVSSTTTVARILPPTAEYNRVAQELAGLYIMLERAWLQASLVRATILEQRVEISSLADVSGGDVRSSSTEDQLVRYCSSFVGDSFYVVRQSSQRALATGSADGCCGCVNNIIISLDEDVLSFLQNRISTMQNDQEGNNAAFLLAEQGQAQLERLRGLVASTTSTGGGILSNLGGALNASQQQQQQYQYELMFGICSALNSVELCVLYTEQLFQHLQTEAEEVLNQDEGIVKFRSCIEGLQDSKHSFDKLLVSGLEKLCSLLKSRVRTQIDNTIGGAKVVFELDDSSYEQIQASDHFALGLVSFHGEQLAMPLEFLSGSNYFWLLEKLADFSAKGIEHAVVRKKFNQLGALQLDKDVRLILQYFVSGADSSSIAGGVSASSSSTAAAAAVNGVYLIRRKFQRLSEIAMILSIDNLDEIHEVWGMINSTTAALHGKDTQQHSSGLTVKEVKRVLGLRSDFKLDEIQKLKLV